MKRRMQNFLPDWARKGHCMGRDHKGNTVVGIGDKEPQVARVKDENRIIVTSF